MKYKIVGYGHLENLEGRVVMYTDAESFEQASDKFFEKYPDHEIDEVVEE